MKRLGAVLGLMLVLGAAWMGLAPVKLALNQAGSSPPEAQALQTAGIRQVSLLAAEGEAPKLFYHLEMDQEAISQLLIQGIRRQQKSIAIPMLLPQGEDEDITQLLLRQVEIAIDSVRRDTPEIFWISLGSYRIEWNGERASGQGNLIVEIEYRPPEEVASMQSQMDGIIAQLMANAPPDPVEAVTYFHDWIVEHTVYASDLMENRTDMRGYEYGFNIDGVFLQGRAVCEGYTKAFKLLCDQASIPCRTVLGVADGQNHSWNYVQLEGEWYLVDATWDDPVGSEDVLLYNHFLKGSQSKVGDKAVAEIYQADYAEYPVLALRGYRES